MYKKYSDKPLVMFDVDDTLVTWKLDSSLPTVTIKNNNINTKFNLCYKNIDSLKKHAARGHTIIVWSAGGSDWAEDVVKALQLEEYVDIIIPKPSWFYDDLEPNDFLKNNLHEGLN